MDNKLQKLNRKKAKGTDIGRGRIEKTHGLRNDAVTGCRVPE
ncbi:hypothetical protein [Oleidesulfovibrio sp.]